MCFRPFSNLNDAHCGHLGMCDWKLSPLVLRCKHDYNSVTCFHIETRSNLGAKRGQTGTLS